MTYHVFRDVDGDMLAPVVNREGVPYEVREDGARTAPGLYDLFFACGVHGFYFFHEGRFYIRALLDASAHWFIPFVSKSAVNESILTQLFFIFCLSV
jgi:hypothetical protein